MKILHWLLGAAIAASLVTGAAADSQGSATGGTAGTQSTGAGCIYNSSAPTLANGQQITLQCDVSGNLKTTGGGGGGGGAVTIANGADVALGSKSDTSSAGTAVGFLNSLWSIFNATPPATSALQTSGNVSLSTIATNTTNAGTPTLQSGSTTAVTQATAGNLNATVVGTGTFATQSTVTQSTASSLNATVVGTGTFAVQATGTLGTTGGWTPKLLNALSTTVVSVKASGGQLGMLQCYNPNSSQIYVQIFNIASGSVSLGSSTPLQSVAIAPTSTGGFALSPIGEEYGTAISVAVTTTATGSTAPSTAADCNAAYN